MNNSNKYNKLLIMQIHKEKQYTFILLPLTFTYLLVFCSYLYVSLGASGHDDLPVLDTILLYTLRTLWCSFPYWLIIQGLATSGIFFNVYLLSLSQYLFNVKKKKS